MGLMESFEEMLGSHMISDKLEKKAVALVAKKLEKDLPAV